MTAELPQQHEAEPVPANLEEASFYVDWLIDLLKYDGDIVEQTGAADALKWARRIEGSRSDILRQSDSKVGFSTTIRDHAEQEVRQALDELNRGLAHYKNLKLETKVGSSAQKTVTEVGLEYSPEKSRIFLIDEDDNEYRLGDIKSLVTTNTQEIDLKEYGFGEENHESDEVER